MKKVFYLISILVLFSLFISGCASKPEKIVFVSQPANNSYVPGSGLVEVSARLKEGVNVAKIEFYVDGAKIGEDFYSPYSSLWDTSYLKHGSSHTVEVRAIDGKGNILDRDSVTCFINVEWTIIMYLDGHNNLASCIQQDIDYIKSFSNTSGVNIVILAGPYQYLATSYLYYCHNGKLDTLFSGAVNFGDAENLRILVSYALSNFPAKKYLMVIEDHGSGWKSKSQGNIDRDICFDERYNNDSLTMPELREGLSSGLLGKKIDLLYLDACLMGNIEVAYELKDVAKYLIFSEATAYGPTRWDLILSFLLSNATCDPISLGIKIIDIYCSAFSNNKITMSLVDLSNVSSIVSELYYFATYLKNCLPNSAQAIMNLRNVTPSFAPFLGSNNEYMDLYYFSALVKNNTSYSDLQYSAENLMNKIQSAVIYNRYIDYTLLGGLSIWFPYVVNDWNLGLTKYADLLFTKSSGGLAWADFLYNELYYYYNTSPNKLSQN